MTDKQLRALDIALRELCKQGVEEVPREDLKILREASGSPRDADRVHTREWARVIVRDAIARQNFFKEGG